jgi:hypothetical protein
MKFIRHNSWKRFFYKVPLSALVKKKIELLFPLSQRKRAGDLLSKKCGITLSGMKSVESEDFDRIRLAVLKVAGGNLVELERVIVDANVSQSKVLEAAGFADDAEAHLQWNP